MKCIITVNEIQASASLNWEKNMNFKMIKWKMFDSNSSTVHFSPFLQLADCSLPKRPFKHSQIFYDYYRDFYTGFSVIKYFD